MTGGYTGKILRIDLTTKGISTIDTAKYEELGGGFGIGAAIFWDLAVAPGEWDLQDAYDPRNVIAIMNGPLGGTGVPGAGRTSVCGVSPATFPTNLFFRANLGGRFGTMLKLAGWDGIVLEGKADNPVWINIVNDKVTIEDARSLWGLNTYETQHKILSRVGGRTRFGEEWQQIGDGFTTSRPQIVCIGPIGETRSRLGALIHGSGTSDKTNPGGYGGVFGAKNLKAISVTGTGSVKTADPKGVVDARLWHVQNFPRKYDSPAGTATCSPCITNDRRRDRYYGGDAMCFDAWWYSIRRDRELPAKAAEILMRWGLNSYGVSFEHDDGHKADIPGAPALFNKEVPHALGLGWYIVYLYELGVLGPGKKIDSDPLPMDQWREVGFREAFCDAIARRVGIGDALAEGLCLAARKWGRLDEDMESGLLRLPSWGSVFHWTLPEVNWAFGGLLGAGDIMWHGFNQIPGGPGRRGPASYTIEKWLDLMSSKTVPYTSDPYMFSYAWKGEDARTTGIYSEHKAKQVAWARHYCGFWNESMGLCEHMPWPLFLNLTRADFVGPTPEAELRYYRAVTGNEASFADTMELGRRIWNLERAIRVMQGRHRDQEKFFPFMYKPGASYHAMNDLPVYENGRWSWQALTDMYLDDAGVELFKTNFYKLEGWDVNTGWPTRKTLDDLSLERVADTLAARGRLGAA